jgi:hypothetical protein
MSTINRACYINPIEPSQMSMRLATGLDTSIDVQYFHQDGSSWSIDVGGQLYLIARTDGTVQQYLLPATDIVNGKARAFIPAGDITDLNGYTIQLIGTIDGGAQLIARGSAFVVATQALGAIPADLIDQIPLTLSYGYGASIDIHLWADAGKVTPFDLTTATITAAIYTDQTNATKLTDFTIVPVGAGEVLLQLTDVQVNALPLTSWWSLRASNASGVTSLCQGTCTVTGAPGP